MHLEPGDHIAVFDLAYGGIVHAARHAARVRGASVATIATEAPYHPDRIVQAATAQLGARTRLLVIDHVTAESALVLPVCTLAEHCRARGILTLVDGAHAPGAIPVQIESLGVDFYTGNLHKWAWSPRSCGILWARPEHQPSLHPPVTSWGLDQGFTTEFDCIGTRDPSAWLAAPAGFRLMEAFGVERVQSYNHDLVWRAAQELAARWNVPFDTPESMVGTMATVALPGALGASAPDAGRLRDALLFEDHIEVQVHAWRNRLWARVSAQIYNDMKDIERLGDAISRRL